VIDVSIVNPITHKSINMMKDSLGNDTLVIQSPPAIFGQFKAAYRSTAGTTIIVSPTTDGSITLTDMIISCDKVQNATITVQFTDGVNTIIIFLGSATDAPINIDIPFAGRWRGWKNARIEMVTVGTLKCNVAIGYYKINSINTQSFSEWDTER